MTKNKIFIDGKLSEIFTEITLIFEKLIKDDVMDIQDLFTIFEAISKCLRNEFSDKEEK